MEPGDDALVERRRIRPVPKGRRIFAMKRRPRARPDQPRTHECSVLARNRFGVWSHTTQRYVRRTRYLRFVRLGSEIWQLDEIYCRPLIKQFGLYAWAEYRERREELEVLEAAVRRLHYDYAPARLKRRAAAAHQEREAPARGGSGSTRSRAGHHRTQ